LALGHSFKHAEYVASGQSLKVFKSTVLEDEILFQLKLLIRLWWKIKLVSCWFNGPLENLSVCDFSDTESGC